MAKIQVTQAFLDFRGVAYTNAIEQELQQKRSVSTLFCMEKPFPTALMKYLTRTNTREFKQTTLENVDYSMNNSITGTRRWIDPKYFILDPITYNISEELLTEWNLPGLGAVGGVSPVGQVHTDIIAAARRIENHQGYRGFYGPALIDDGKTVEQLDPSMVIPVDWNTSGGTARLPITVEKLVRLKQILNTKFAHGQPYLIITPAQQAVLEMDVQLQNKLYVGIDESLRERVTTAEGELYRVLGINIIVDPQCPTSEDGTTAYCPFFIREGLTIFRGANETKVIQEDKASRTDAYTIKSNINLTSSRNHRYMVGAMLCDEPNKINRAGTTSNVVVLDGSGNIIDVKYVGLTA